MAEDQDGVERRVERDGRVLWYRYGVLHRDNGPAVEYPSGEQWWFQFGKEHREDGPAIIRPDGSKEWFRDGKCHREDGPAVERLDGTQRWYLNGELWEDGPSVIARQRAEKARAVKSASMLKPRWSGVLMLGRPQAGLDLKEKSSGRSANGAGIQVDR